MQTPLRILFVISGLEKGGAETQLYRLLTQLQKNNVVVHVFALRGGHYVSVLRKQKIDVTVAHTKATNLLQSASSLYKIMDRFKPNLIHTWLPHANIFTKMCLTFKYRNIPIITSVRVKEKKYWKQMLVERATDFRSTKTLVNQKAIIGHLRSYGFAKKKIEYIGNIFESPKIDSNRVKSITKKFNTPLILTVGHFRPQKNYLNNIEALIQLHKQIKFDAIYIGGPGKDFQTIKKHIKTHNIKYITLLPADSDVINYMKACDVFFLPSLYEGQSNVLMEALSVGTPIVTSNLEENQWLKGAAAFCNPKNTTSMVQMLSKTLQNKQHNKHMHKIQTFIKQQHDSKNITKSYLQLYTEVVSDVRN